jgi:hypothetical protein
MKRHLVSLCFIVLLVSCSKQGDLPPSEVLKKAAESSQKLQSAGFNLTASFHGRTELLAGQLTGKVAMAGRMANAGQQLQFSLRSDIERVDSQNNSSDINVSADFIIGGEKDVYMKVHALTVTPPGKILSPELVSHLLNQWWLIPTETGSRLTATPISPDPSMLQMQTEVISVVKDKGLSKINGRLSYEYEVAVDQTKMQNYLANLYRLKGGKTPDSEEQFRNMNAKGMLWIDAESFVIHKIVWDITSTDPVRPQTAHIDVSINDHNVPVIITLPEAAVPFPSISH